MVFAACLDAPNVFLLAFAASLASDFVDGLIARAFHQGSSLGAVLDTCGDVTMYIAAVIGGWFLWPGLMKQEAVYVSTALLLIIASGVLGFLKHRRLPSYHTWSAKLATAAIGIAALIMFSGVSSLPFRIAVLVLAVSAVEEMAITLTLPEWRPNIRSFLHAAKLRKSRKSGNTRPFQEPG
jgi:CDP-diacylglycerol--glycerol-3-phosphate 3-phosphatidyltransferase